MQSDNNIEIIDLGIVAYQTAYEKQKDLFEDALNKKASKDAIQNKVLYCEHPHVITVGKHGLFSNLLFPEELLQKKGVELYHVDRGGDITYHGPGQIVGYPIFDLDSFHIGLKEYIHRVEEVIIRTIAEYGVEGKRLDGATGVWLDIDSKNARKIAAIGVRSSRFVTMHGFALNINTDLDYFSLINPCGFTDKGVTSLATELGKQIDLEEVKQKLSSHFNNIFL